MRIRLALTLDIGRRHQPPDDDFEHRDNDTAIEATGGGDHRTHRMGFVPDDPEERR